MDRKEVLVGLELLTRLLSPPGRRVVFTGGAIEILVSHFGRQLREAPSGKEQELLETWAKGFDQFRARMLETTSTRNIDDVPYQVIDDDTAKKLVRLCPPPWKP